MRKVFVYVLPILIALIFGVTLAAGPKVEHTPHTLEQVMSKAMLNKAIKVANPVDGKFHIQVLPQSFGIADKVINIEQDHIVVEQAGRLTVMIIPMNSIGSITSYKTLEQ